MNAHTSLPSPAQYEVVYDDKTGQLTLSNTDTHWSIPTREDLISAGGIWTGSVLDKNDLHECYDVIGYTNTSYVLEGVLQNQGFVDLIPYKSLFLCSSTFGNLGQSVGPKGQSDIIRRIVITQGFGNVIFDAHSTHADYVDCSLTQINQMRWRLTDEEGRDISLKKKTRNFVFGLLFGKVECLKKGLRI